MKQYEPQDAHIIRKTHFLSPDEYICSECSYSDKEPFSVCPSCGSEMSGTKSDSTWVDEVAMIDIISGR